jgi:hypothetical protein
MTLRSPEPFPETTKSVPQTLLSYVAGRYYAQVGDDCSFCTYGGPGVAPPSRGSHPPTDQAVWCGFKGPCLDVLREASSRASSALLAEGAESVAFPTDCTLKQWQNLGMDLDSVVADPMIDTQTWQLKPGSPALKLGFKQLNLSTVGPRLQSPQKQYRAFKPGGKGG